MLDFNLSFLLFDDCEDDGSCSIPVFKFLPPSSLDYNCLNYTSSLQFNLGLMAPALVCVECL